MLPYFLLNPPPKVLSHFSFGNNAQTVNRSKAIIAMNTKTPVAIIETKTL